MELVRVAMKDHSDDLGVQRWGWVLLQNWSLYDDVFDRSFLESPHPNEILRLPSFVDGVTAQYEGITEFYF